MTMDMFLILLLIVSTLTGLVVEGIKSILGNKEYSKNILASIVSVVLSVVIGVFYCIMAEAIITAKLIIILIALVFLSWLCAMVGYDKVLQTINQIKGGNK